MKKLKNIGLVAFDKRLIIKSLITTVVEDKTLEKLNFFIPQKTFEYSHKRITKLSQENFFNKIDALVSIGGDGTFISAARLASTSKVPLIGVKMGTLGFLTDISADTVLSELNNIASGKYNKEQLLMFDVAFKSKRRKDKKDICFNDVVIKGNKLFNMSVYHGNELVSEYNADGMIVSTPTGSTAYTMAAGGPIVYPSLECVIITPICSHSLTQKPIVCSIKKPITLRVDDKDAKLTASLDGKNNFSIGYNDEIKISKSSLVTTVLHPLDRTYFGVLRKKLNWGK